MSAKCLRCPLWWSWWWHNDGDGTYPYLNVCAPFPLLTPSVLPPPVTSLLFQLFSVSHSNFFQHLPLNLCPLFSAPKPILYTELKPNQSAKTIQGKRTYVVLQESSLKPIQSDIFHALVCSSQHCSGLWESDHNVQIKNPFLPEWECSSVLLSNGFKPTPAQPTVHSTYKPALDPWP